LIHTRKLEVYAEDELPAVRVDGDLIQMVVAHLIDNAVKYSPAGSPIAVGARVDDGKVVMFVRDHGPGVSEEQRSRIFERFYRGVRDKGPKGTGMGLVIAREILRAHGQDIWVAGDPGQGSEFCFSLPVVAESN